jgi:ATP-dependent protease ClpP protease subunit
MKKILATIIGLVMLVGTALPASGLMGYINRQTIMLYGEVVSGDEVEIRVLFDGQEEEYQIIINSHGGRAFVCMSIAQHIRSLQDMGKKVTTEVSGMALSSGAILWIMGDIRIAHRNDVIMFHGVQMINPATQQPVPEELLEDSDKFIMDTLNRFLVEELTKIVGKKKAEKMIEGETWLTGKQAFDMGLATILK